MPSQVRKEESGPQGKEKRRFLAQAWSGEEDSGSANSMSGICVVPGSYDPITCGHMDIIEGAAALFDTAVVAVLDSFEKRYMFTHEERLNMVSAACAHLPGVRVVLWRGLLVDLLKQQNARIIVRGLRDVRDYESERQIAAVNAKLLSGTRTVWLQARPDRQAVSSTIVRELLAFGADVAPFVPEAVLALTAARSVSASGGKEDGAGGQPLTSLT